MKYLTAFLLTFFGVINHVKAQIPPPDTLIIDEDKYKIYTKVDVEASFNGGEPAWRKYLVNNLDIDKVVRKIRIPKGEKEFRETIIVKFIVNKEGELSDVRAENADANKYCIAEAIRVIKDSPNWVPAKQNGRIVNAYRRQPITFIFQQ